MVAYLLPGNASLISDPDAPTTSPEILQNRNICRRSEGRPVEQDGVELFTRNDGSCPTGVFRNNESNKVLSKHYPLELVTQAKFNGILLKNASITSRAAGLLPLGTDGPTTDNSTPTPQRTPTKTPTQKPTEPPCHPSRTPTKVATKEPTRRPTEPPCHPSRIPTRAATNTPTQAPTRTPTPSVIPTKAPLCEEGEYRLQKTME